MKNIITKNRKIWLAVSGVLVIASIIFIAVFGLRFGIDFTGGSLIEIRLPEDVSFVDFKSTVNNAELENVSLQSTDENGVIIRTKDLSEEEHKALLSALEMAYGEIEELRFDSIGPVIGKELKRTAFTGVIITIVLIALYVAWAFRKVSEPVASWKYGLLTIIAAFHDVIITVGAFAFLGLFFNWEVGTAFVAAILTILGYSINDTVVIFDRARENLIRRLGRSFEDTIEVSIQQTFKRSINTSLTTLLTLFSVFIFGGDSTRPFALALIIGIIVGTYSSIFIAAPLLVIWELRGKR